MDWGSVASVVIGAIVGASTSLLTTDIAYRRTRSDQIRDVKRATYAQYLSALSRFPGQVTRFKADPERYEPEARELLKEMADHQAAISLLSPEIHPMLDTDEVIGDMTHQQRVKLVDEHIETLRSAMRRDLEQ